MKRSHADLKRMASWLRRAGRYATILLTCFGLWSFFETVRPLLPDAPEKLTWGERRVMGAVAVVTLGGFGLAAWMADRLLRLSGELIEVVIDGADSAERTADLTERHLVPSLNRIAEALERLAPRPGAQEFESSRAARAVREAIRDGRWALAEQLADTFARDRPGPEATSLRDELAEARDREIDRLRDELDRARAANDLGAAIDTRDRLTLHLRGDELHELDVQTVRWLCDAIRRQSRNGPVTAELARVAARAVDSFGDTPEGASLRSALPSLRRKAGLCPRCGRPYRGPAEACPDCLEDEPAPVPRPTARPAGPRRSDR